MPQQEIVAGSRVADEKREHLAQHKTIPQYQKICDMVSREIGSILKLAGHK